MTEHDSKHVSADSMRPRMAEDNPKHVSADSARLTMTDVVDLAEKAADLGQLAKETKQDITKLGSPQELESRQQRNARMLAAFEEAFALKRAYEQTLKTQ